MIHMKTKFRLTKVVNVSKFMINLKYFLLINITQIWLDFITSFK